MGAPFVDWFVAKDSRAEESKRHDNAIKDLEFMGGEFSGNG